MTDAQQTGSRRDLRNITVVAALIGTGAVAGMVLAGTIGASAATGSTTTRSAGTDFATNPMPGAPHGPNQGSAPVRSDESSLSAGDVATVKAAALKAVPGGTVYRIETDAGDGAYEAHMTKADGSLVTVKLDRSFAVIRVEPGMGQGDPGMNGPGFNGPGSPASPPSTGSSSRL